MNISRSQLDSIINLYKTCTMEAKNRDKEKTRQNYTDQLNISTSAMEFMEAVKLASRSDEVRAEKVEALRQKIQSGTYDIDGKLVAEKIIEEFRAGRLV